MRWKNKRDAKLAASSLDLSTFQKNKKQGEKRKHQKCAQGGLEKFQCKINNTLILYVTVHELITSTVDSNHI